MKDKKVAKTIRFDPNDPEDQKVIEFMNLIPYNLSEFYKLLALDFFDENGITDPSVLSHEGALKLIRNRKHLSMAELIKTIKESGAMSETTEKTDIKKTEARTEKQAKKTNTSAKPEKPASVKNPAEDDDDYINSDMAKYMDAFG